jgi:hypothetical protein
MGTLAAQFLTTVARVRAATNSDRHAFVAHDQHVFIALENSSA